MSNAQLVHQANVEVLGAPIDVVAKVAAIESIFKTGFIDQYSGHFLQRKRVENRQKAIHRIRCEYQLQHGMNRLMDIVHSLLNKVGGFANRKANFWSVCL